MPWVLYLQLKAPIQLDRRLKGLRAVLDMVVMRKIFILAGNLTPVL
jgi:hypothetical protein